MKQSELTLEQHGLEMHGTTYMWIFFKANSIVLHDTWLVEFMDVEPQTQRSDYKVTCEFSPAQRVGVPSPLVVQGSTV